MIIKDYFINLSIFSLLVSAAIFIQVFTINSSRYFEKLYGGIIAVTLMFFSFSIHGIFLRSSSCSSYSIFYLLWSYCWLDYATSIILIFYIGEYWEPPVIAYLCMGILFSTFKIYVKTHPFKSASLYFSVLLE